MIHGILNIYKEAGYTSHDVVAKLRGILGQRKIGHTGTLDPDARGVLPVCVGQATKVCSLLTDHDKVYETVLLLGRTTDTQDISGQVLEERDTVALTKERVEQCIASFVGTYEQLPPMYSAIKVQGKRLYELAREGKTVERTPRQVTIQRIRLLDISLPRVTMEVQCSKGTYIRTLCQDIGERLGCGGCMENLLRTRVGDFSLADSVKLSQVEEACRKGTFSEMLLPVDRLFLSCPAGTVKADFATLAYNGNPLPKQGVMVGKTLREKGIQDTNWEDKGFQEGQMIRLYDRQGRFIGLFRYQKETWQVEKMFLTGNV